MKKLRVLALLTMAGLCSVGYAQPTALSQYAQPQLSFGLAGVVLPQYDGADRYRVIPFPTFRWVAKGGYSIQTSGLGVEANISPWRGFTFGPIVRYRFGRGDKSNPIIQELTPVKAAIEGGGYASVAMPINEAKGRFVALRSSYLHDMNGSYNGYLVQMGVNYIQLITQKVYLVIGPGTNYASQNFMDTFFGISPADSLTSGLPPYAAKAGFKDANMSAILNYQFAKKWSVAFFNAYARLVGSAGNSPVVKTAGSRNQFYTAVMVSYRVY